MLWSKTVCTGRLATLEMSAGTGKWDGKQGRLEFPGPKASEATHIHKVRLCYLKIWILLNKYRNLNPMYMLSFTLNSEFAKYE